MQMKWLRCARWLFPFNFDCVCGTSSHSAFVSHPINSSLFASTEKQKWHSGYHSTAQYGAWSTLKPKTWVNKNEQMGNRKKREEKIWRCRRPTTMEKKRKIWYEFDRKMISCRLKRKWRIFSDISPFSFAQCRSVLRSFWFLFDSVRLTFNSVGIVESNIIIKQ